MTYEPRFIYRGYATHRFRSGEVRVRVFYVWAKDDSVALRDAERVFPRATRIVVKKRGDFTQ